MPLSEPQVHHLLLIPPKSPTTKSCLSHLLNSRNHSFPPLFQLQPTYHKFFPSSCNILLPSFHLDNSYSSFTTQSQHHLLQEAAPDLPKGADPPPCFQGCSAKRTSSAVTSVHGWASPQPVGPPSPLPSPQPGPAEARAPRVCSSPG